MGLGVYVGTLARYYSEGWETFWQRAAREAGGEGMRVRVSGDELQIISGGDPDAPAETAPAWREAVLAWREALERQLSDGPEPVEFDWDEAGDKPYFTRKPDWTGYAPLVLHAAYAPGPAAPRRSPRRLAKRPAYKATTGENFEGSPCIYIMAPELWLPGDFYFVFQTEDFRVQGVVIG